VPILAADKTPEKGFVPGGVVNGNMAPLFKGATDALRADHECTDNARMNLIMAYCTCPDEAAAQRIATALIEEHLAACVNRISGIASTYRWKGDVCQDVEVLLVIKTVRERFEALRERIIALHPYELPEVIAVDIALGHAPYLDWIARESGS
jgi:periplasmic divalent cation tolerance protein